MESPVHLYDELQASGPLTIEYVYDGWLRDADGVGKFLFSGVCVLHLFEKVAQPPSYSLASRPVYV